MPFSGEKGKSRKPATIALKRLLSDWDQGSKVVRERILRDFIKLNEHRTAPELEDELAEGASLFLARLTAWLRLTYMLGTCIQLQLKAISIFVGSCSGYKFLNEFIEVGGIMTALEILGLRQATEEGKMEALRLLLIVAKGGRKYKELICESFGVKAVAECLARVDSDNLRDKARVLLHELANGNPKYQPQVYKALIALLSSSSPSAKQMAAKTLRIIQPMVGRASSSVVEPVLMMLRSCHLGVQYEACELLKHLVEYEDVSQSILVGIVSLLRPSVDENTSQSKPSILADDSIGAIPAPLPVFIQQAGAAHVLGILTRSSPALAERIIKLRAIHNLLFALGNRAHPDSQRQAALTLSYLIDNYPLISEKIGAAIGDDFFQLFMAERDRMYISLTDVQSDILVSNQVNIPAGMISRGIQAWK
ncbi:armadillo-like helical domain containing protein 1 [Corticium candelabrum]|uniref:armadillo-like helical domain containing protein 1 n=1 Tax=Corticium candelabrum TaxID=121492 RepID=UPI002E276BB9|nr:armadillo-like helical domain containing protein 1 [Corticium candelabrum]